MEKLGDPWHLHLAYDWSFLFDYLHWSPGSYIYSKCALVFKCHLYDKSYIAQDDCTLVLLSVGMALIYCILLELSLLQCLDVASA